MSKPSFPIFWVSLGAVVLGGGIFIWWGESRSASQPKPAPRITAKAPAATPTAEHAPEPPAVVSEEAAALDAVLKNPDPQQRIQAFSQHFAQWVAQDLDAALGYLRGMPRGTERSQAMSQLIHTLIARDPDRALALAGELVTSRDDRYIYASLFDRFARQDVKAAIARLDRVPAGEARENALRAVINVWTQTDANAALAWAQQLTDPDDRVVAIEAALQNVAQRDPTHAIELAQTTLENPARERTIFQALHMLINSDPNAAAKLVTLLPPGDMQISVATSIARALAQKSNMESALAWVQTLPVELTQWMVLNNMLVTWWQREPTAAARYVLNMQPSGTLDFIAPQMASLMTGTPKDAILWAEALPSDSAREASLVTVASTWAQRTPEEAVRWAASLQTEPLRTNATNSAFTPWLLQDPVAAQAWLETANFPAETKSIMLRTHMIKP